MEMPVDVLNTRLGKIRDNSDPDFDNTAAAVDIDTELQEKFLFFPIEELEALQEVIEENRDGIYLGQGIGYATCPVDADPQDLLIRAENALALYLHVKKKQEALAKRPEPGVYQVRRNGRDRYFTVIVDEARRLWVPQHEGGMLDHTRLYEKASHGNAHWVLQRVDLTDGSISK